MDYGDWLLALIAGILAAMAVRVAAARLEYRYQWKCGAPDCDTYARSNSKEAVEMCKHIHYESHPEHEGASK